jgi:hypothetical protein
MGKTLLVSTFITLTFCGTLCAASAVTEDDIRAWLALWQKREGLEHRDIRLSFVHQSVLGRNFVADVEWWETPGVASIRCLYPGELQTVFGDTPAEAREEAQRMVIHELLHLVLAGLYDDGDGRGNIWIHASAARDARMEAITENLAVMLLRGRVPGGLSVARYIARQVNSGPWKPARDVRERVMLQVAHAMDAATDDDVLMLASR